MRRIDKFISVWDGRSPVILSTGFTRYKAPIIAANGIPAIESRVAAQEVHARGVPRAKILVEETSSDTIGNIYFAMLLFIQPLGLKTVSIVTSAFHLPRARAVSEWIFELAGWSTMPVLRFEAARDPDMSPHVRKHLEAKEADGLQRIAHLRQTIRRVPDMCLWLQMEHNAYRFDATVGDLPQELILLY